MAQKNRNIFLVRHGESTANLDHMRYAKDHDFKVPLTTFGHEQAVDAGKALKQFFDEHPELQGKKIRVYYSPYLRTQQTKDGIVEGAADLLSNEASNVQFREDSLLRERDFGVFTQIRNPEDRLKKFSAESAYIKSLTNKKGDFYAPIPMGESMADTTVRMETFKEKMMSSIERNDIDVCIIVAHNDSIACFEKAFFHHDIEWLKKREEFKNGDIKLLHKEGEKPYTSEVIFNNKQRSPHIPNDYKTSPYGVEAPSMAI